MSSPPPPPPPPPPLFCSLHRIFVCVCVCVCVHRERNVRRVPCVFVRLPQPCRGGGREREREREVAAFFFPASGCRFGSVHDGMTWQCFFFFFFFLRKSHTAVCRPSTCPYYSMAVMPGSMQASARGCTWYFHPCTSRKMTLWWYSDAGFWKSRQSCSDLPISCRLMA